MSGLTQSLLELWASTRKKYVEMFVIRIKRLESSLVAKTILNVEILAHKPHRGARRFDGGELC